MIGIVVVLAAAVLVVGSHLRSTLIAYLVFTAATLALTFPHLSETQAMLFFAGIALVKLVVSPLMVLYIVKRYGIAENLAPSVNLTWRIALVLVAVVAGREAGHMAAFREVANAGTVFTALFVSSSIIVIYRNLMAHVIGLLAIGSAISLAGTVFAPGLSGAIELAATFDIVIASGVALAIARVFAAIDPRLDIRSLRELRG